MSELRDDISRVLKRFPPKPLALGAVAAESDFNKAGILPFLPAASMENWRVLVMKPVSQRSQLGPPPLQLCKGTRMHDVAGQWQDMRDEATWSDERESLALAALREGIEELGLALDHIRGLYDAGPFSFSSASTGKAKQVWMFAAEISSEEGLLPEDRVAPTTGERRWLALPEALKLVREDHIPILRRMTAMLAGHYE